MLALGSLCSASPLVKSNWSSSSLLKLQTLLFLIANEQKKVDKPLCEVHLI